MPLQTRDMAARFDTNSDEINEYNEVINKRYPFKVKVKIEIYLNFFFSKYLDFALFESFFQIVSRFNDI